MARGRVLLAGKTGIQGTIRNQRDSIVYLRAVKPCVHGRGHINDDVIALRCFAKWNACGDGCSQCRRQCGRDGLLRPGAGDVVHVEASRRGDCVHIELQTCLCDISAGVAGGDRGQIELDVTDLGGTLDVQSSGSSELRRRERGVGVRVGFGCLLGERGNSKQRRQKETQNGKTTGVRHSASPSNASDSTDAKLSGYLTASRFDLLGLGG